MTTGSVEITRPSSRAFEGMKRILFRPFDIGKWFVLGFTAWVAGFMEGGCSGGGGGGSVNTSRTVTGDRDTVSRTIHEGTDWVRENWEVVFGVGAVVVLIGFAVFLALLWLSSRGKFMFLDNVVHDRAEVTAPWNDFRAEGNSLFWWRLGFMLVSGAVIVLIGGAAALGAMSLRENEALLLLLIPVGLILFALGLVITYVGVLLEDFVVPLMYRNRSTTNAAWGRFLKLHNGAIGWFILYALWRMLLKVAITLCFVAVGFMTCCVGLVLVSLPYLGAVLLLPVSVFFRLLGPEFMKQFGTEYELRSSETPPPVE